MALFTQQPHLRRLVPVAIDRAIREIISPVVERSVTIACITTVVHASNMDSPPPQQDGPNHLGLWLIRSVTIACITTRELVVKDFAMEPVRQLHHPRAGWSNHFQ